MLKLDILVGHLTDEYRINVPGIYDIDAKFNRIKVENTDYNRRAVYSIDKGQLLDKGCFIDRFGRTLKVDSLSTGCKTAILVGAFPTQLVSAIESGDLGVYIEPMSTFVVKSTPQPDGTLLFTLAQEV